MVQTINRQDWNVKVLKMIKGLHNIRLLRYRVSKIRVLHIKGIDRGDPSSVYMVQYCMKNVTEFTRITAYEANLLSTRSNTDQRKNLLTE